MAVLRRFPSAVEFLVLIIPVLGAAIAVAGQAESRAQLPGSSRLVSYRAAATQYLPASDWQAGPQAILEANFKTIVELSQNASLQGADIIVLPEYGVTGLDLGENRTQFRALCQVVPHPSDHSVPCTQQVHADNFWVVQSLSCLALQLDMYIVVDLAELVLPSKLSEEDSKDSHNSQANCEVPCPSLGGDRCGCHQTDELPADLQAENFDSLKSNSQETDAEEDFIAYNSQVVFDRTGEVIARYRKKHLFFEPEFEYGNEDDSTALFTTDFGVTFTLQVCFDIMYSSPAVANIVGAGVRDVAMSTTWIDELPFLTAPQIFNGFSRGLSSNLIVSNLFNPSSGEVGSGIFHGNKEPKYTYDFDTNEPILIVDDMTTEVEPEIWVKFEEKRNLLATKLTEKNLESFPLLQTVDEEQINFGDRQEILDDSLISEAGHSLRNAGMLHRNDTHIREVLTKKYSSMRKIAKWRRFKNQQVCSETCKKVKFLLQQSKSRKHCPFTHSSPLDKKASISSAVKSSKTSTTAREKSADDVKSNDVLKSNLKENENYHFIIHENVSFYAHEVLPFTQNASVVSCYDNFCCEAKYTFQDSEESSTRATAAYMLLAYNGTVAKGSGTYWMWTQVCAVVFCVDRDDVNSCAAIDEPMPDIRSDFRLENITGNFETNFIFPSVFNLNFQLVNNTLWSSSTVPGQLLIQGAVDNLLTAVLFGRKYSLDR